eukprot:Opistho-1_new@82128
MLRLLLVTLVAVGAVVANVPDAETTTPCCRSCVAPLEKYYSVDKTNNMCGECCMDPKDYDLYKIFEPGLTLASDNSPCADLKFTNYSSTVTHGFGPISMTLDLYKPVP